MGAAPVNTLTTKTARNLGWVIGKTEFFNTHTNRHQDLYGFVDYVACCPGEGVRFLQVTSGSNLANRIQKVVNYCRGEAMEILQTPGAIIEFWGWRKLKLHPATRERVRRQWWCKRCRLELEAGLFKTVELEDL